MKSASLIPLLAVIAALGACDLLRKPAGGWEDTAAPAAAPQPRPAAGTAAPRLAPQNARSAAAFDRTTEAERAAAVAAPVTGGALGEVVVSLGNPAEPGFWLRSGLVTAQRPGSVRIASGASVQVDLLPLGGGGGPQLSLAAYRALGLGLTDLPKVTVYGR